MIDSLPFPAEPIEVGHAEDLQQRFAQAGKRAWCYFAPFLCSYSLPPGRVVLVAEHKGALVLLVQTDGRRGRRIDLMVPPLPMDDNVLDEVVEVLQAKGPDRPPRIHWVDGDDANHPALERFQVQEKEIEYLYDPAQVHALTGRTYRDLRKRIRRAERVSAAGFREMSPGDIPGCEKLLRRWRQLQGRKHPFLLDWGYTRAALASFECWSQDVLRGWCAEVDGKIAAFALAGEMLPGQANFFVAKSDPEVRGLSEFLRWRVMGELRDYDRVNDAGDLGLMGLRQFKEKLRPVERVKVYTARMER